MSMNFTHRLRLIHNKIVLVNQTRKVQCGGYYTPVLFAWLKTAPRNKIGILREWDRGVKRCLLWNGEAMNR